MLIGVFQSVLLLLLEVFDHYVLLLYMPHDTLLRFSQPLLQFLTVLLHISLLHLSLTDQDL